MSTSTHRGQHHVFQSDYEQDDHCPDPWSHISAACPVHHLRTRGRAQSLCTSCTTLQNALARAIPELQQYCFWPTIQHRLTLCAWVSLDPKASAGALKPGVSPHVVRREVLLPGPTARGINCCRTSCLQRQFEGIVTVMPTQANGTCFYSFGAADAGGRMHALLTIGGIWTRSQEGSFSIMSHQ